ncbi:MAG: transaldolase [Actinobacteria bacterium]|nr:transaldolase [Actinomycetota bacterium]
MTALQRLHSEQHQSPWLDNLRRDDLGSGALAALVDRGIRGVTSNPSIFKSAIEGTDAYDEQFGSEIASGRSITDAYWELVITDITDALDVLEPVHEASGGEDGFVSIEVAPDIAHDSARTVDAAAGFHDRIDRSNLYVKIPGTAEGVKAIEEMIARGKAINVTLLFSVERYGEVIDAYLSGLERFAEAGGDVSTVRSVASFFVSRVDTEIDRRLDELGTDEARALKGRAGIANAKLAYALFTERFSGDRWHALAAAGAHVQRPLWASTSTKDPAYPDTLYIDELIGPDTVNTIPNATIDAFDDHGTVARTIDVDLDAARADVAALAALGIDLEDVATVLEREGVDKFIAAFDELIGSLTEKAAHLQATG